LIQTKGVRMGHSSLLQHDQVCRFHEGPLQHSVYVSAYLAILVLPPLELTRGTKPA
jgi:hypothetical protein